MMEICATIQRFPHLAKNFAQLMDNTELALWFKTELHQFCVLIGLRKWFIVNTVAMAPSLELSQLSDDVIVIDTWTYLKVDKLLFSF